MKRKSQNRRWFVTTACATGILISAATAHGVDPTPLKTPAELTQYCEHDDQSTLAPLSTEATRSQNAHVTSIYSVQLNARDLPASRTSQHVLEVPLSDGVSLQEGLVLDLSPKQVLRWPEETGSSSQLADRYERKEISVELVFVPPPFHRVTSPSCVHEGASTRLLGTLLEARLVDDDDAPVAIYQTDLGRALAQIRAQANRLKTVQSRPHVHISNLVVLSAYEKASKSVDHAEADPSHAKIQGELAYHLLDCYAIGLVDNTRMQGALVVSWTSGKPESARILINSVGHARATSCVMERLAAIAVGPLNSSKNQTFKATAIFRLTPSTSP